MARRIVSAISFGVFCRFAPSTRPIMRSRNVWPRSAVIRTTIRSESTLVPPVTAERSPPDSRMTGADSPVMADSSTEAMPSTMSPSEGMRSPASHTTMSPLASAEAGTRSSVPSGRSRRASVSARMRRSDSAWALPRPSAIASAKLAKITVRKSQAVMLQLNRPGWATESMTVTTVPTSTTNITGFFTCTRGSSFLNDPTTACRRISGSKRLRDWATPRGGGREADAEAAVVTVVISEELSVAELFDERAEGDGREEGQAADDEDDAHEETDEQRCVGAEGAEPGGHELLLGERAGQRQHRDHDEEAAGQHGHRPHHVVEGRVPGQVGEGRTVVVPVRGEGVEDLGEPVRAGVAGAGPAGVQGDGDGGEDEHGDRHHEHGERRELHLARLDLLAQVLGRAPDHEPAQEHGDDGEQEDGVEPAPHTAGRHLAEHHPRQQSEAADGGERVVGPRHRPGGGLGGGDVVQAGGQRAEADLLAHHVALMLGDLMGGGDGRVGL